jgi:hypothetical protein
MIHRLKEFRFVKKKGGKVLCKGEIITKIGWGHLKIFLKKLMG